MKNKEIVKKLRDSLDYEFDLSFNNRKELLSYIEQIEECYCNRTDCIGRIKDSKKYDSLLQKYEQLQNNRDKAIEMLTYKQNAFSTCFSVCDVIDILKGDSDV